MNKLTYSKLVTEFAKQTGITNKVARHQLDVLRGLIGNAVVSGHAVTLMGIMTINPVHQPASPARTVLGRQVAAQPARMLVKASVSNVLKAAVKARWEVSHG